MSLVHMLVVRTGVTVPHLVYMSESQGLVNVMMEVVLVVCTAVLQLVVAHSPPRPARIPLVAVVRHAVTLFVILCTMTATHVPHVHVPRRTQGRVCIHFLCIRTYCQGRYWMMKMKQLPPLQLLPWPWLLPLLLGSVLVMLVLVAVASSPT